MISVYLIFMVNRFCANKMLLKGNIGDWDKTLIGFERLKCDSSALCLGLKNGFVVWSCVLSCKPRTEVRRFSLCLAPD